MAERRAKGEGGIYQRKDGRLVGQYVAERDRCLPRARRPLTSTRSAVLNRPTRVPSSEISILVPSRVSWYGTAGVQAALITTFVLVFDSAVATRSARALRRRSGAPPKMSATAPRWRLLATAVSTLDLVVLIGLVTMVAEVIRVNGLGPPSLWTFLQALGLLAVVLTLALLVATAAAAPRGTGAPLTAQAGHLLVVLTAVLSVPFMLYWTLVYFGL